MRMREITEIPITNNYWPLLRVSDNRSESCRCPLFQIPGATGLWALEGRYRWSGRICHSRCQVATVVKYVKVAANVNLLTTLTHWERDEHDSAKCLLLQSLEESITLCYPFYRWGESFFPSIRRRYVSTLYRHSKAAVLSDACQRGIYMMK